MSLAINYSDSANFGNAGYAEIQAGDAGGLVRQYGNLSFSRVFEAGHEIPSYQPQTAYNIFMRALFNKDIATGEQNTYGPDGEVYSSEGPSDTWEYRNDDPPDPTHFCYVLEPYTLCSEAQIESIVDGTACIQNYIVVDANSTALFPDVVGDAQCATGENYSSGGGYGGNASTSAMPPMQTANSAALSRRGWMAVVAGVTIVAALVW